MNKKGLLLVISGPSGTGKSTVISNVMQERKDIFFSVSATTRDPRPGEADGKSYHFISREKFSEMIDKDAFLEYAQYATNAYGTPAAPVDAALAEGKCALLDIEVQGAAQVMARRADCVSVFLAPPSMEELERRLRGRGTDPEEKILQRLEIARRECSLAGNYDYIIINENIRDASNELEAIIAAGFCRKENRIETMQNILKGDHAL